MINHQSGTTPSSPPSAGGGRVIELAPVIYDTPIIQHTITTQHNVAYGGTIPLKHNEAYQLDKPPDNTLSLPGPEGGLILFHSSTDHITSLISEGQN